jgi:hypothetical protein
MHLERLKRWQWACIGLVLGLGFSLWRGWVGPEHSLLGRSTLEPVEFEKLLVQKSKLGKPLLRDIRVYRLNDQMYWLTAEQLLQRGEDDPGRYVAVKIPARTPYVPAIDSTARLAPDATVVDYLNAVKAKQPTVAFSTRWWAHEPARSPLFALIGMVLIGGLFPPLVGVLGTGRQREEKQEPEYDLSRFGKGRPQAARAGGHQITEQDLAHVRELDDELERRLAGRGGQGSESPVAPAATPAAQQAPAQPIRKLSGGTLEAQAEQTRQAKEYDGEFYPTETHVKHKET